MERVHNSSFVTLKEERDSFFLFTEESKSDAGDLREITAKSDSAFLQYDIHYFVRKVRTNLVIHSQNIDNAIK